MQQYTDSDNNSNVEAYEYGDDYILVEFKSGLRYKYTYNSAGSSDIEEMKRLADVGDGLNSFISLNKPNYEEKY